jgi:exopolysaccharide biosynthesis polyprenyl glycosylphosphotransferase
VTAPLIKPPGQLAAAPRDLSRETHVDRTRPRLSRVLGPGLLVLSDLVAVNLAFYVAWYLRYELMLGGDVEPFDVVAYDVYLPLGLVLSALVVAIFFFGSLYRRHQAAFWFNEFFAILGRCGIAVMALFAFSTMLRYPASSRLTFIYAWLLATIFAALGRVLVQSAMGLLHRGGVGTERVVIVGDDSMGRMVMQGIAAQPHLGLQVVGFLGARRVENFGRFHYLGPVDEVDQICRDFGIDQVIIALPSTSHELQLRMVEHCRRAGVRFKLVPDLFEMSLSRIDLDTVSGVPLIDLKEVSIEGGSLLLKRAFDLALTFLALVPGSVVLLVVALLVRLESSGPIVYKQTRVGKAGRLFTLYKFRSMRVGAEHELEQLLPFNEQRGPIFKKRDDPRLTRAGRLIRRASLDELPQLFNVLKGDMSLVGPRPPLPSEVAQYEDWHRRRLQVAPGLTGLWQVSGRSGLNFEEMVVFDLAYIQNWSLGLDLSILLRTVPAVIAGRGAF